MVLGGRTKIHALPQVHLQGKYRKLNAVGSGAYGEVFKVLDLASHAIYVWKEAILAKVDASFANEIATLTKLRHPHIVSIREWGTEEGKICIVLEFVEAGSLDDLIHQLKQPMPETMLREYVRQILVALEYCHLHGVVHRDVKAKNILVTKEGTLKLADFGGAKEAVALMGTELLEATAGLQATILWMAPELYDSRFNCKADIWSLGCTIIEMATRKKPWDEQNFENIFTAMNFLKKAKSGPPMPKNLSEAAQNFVNRCFIRDHTLRPTATELLADEWFRGTDGASLTSPFGFSVATSETSTVSTGSEAPQGPTDSTPSVVGPSNSTSVTQVKFNLGDAVISGSQPSRTPFSMLAEMEEEEKRNWIFDLGTSGSLGGTISHVSSPEIGLAPDQMLSTMDFLSMKSPDND